jgi:nucleoside-triphosphatase THEP1
LSKKLEGFLFFLTNYLIIIKKITTNKEQVETVSIIEHDTILLKLTYLWAFTEAALGGLLHLLHIPITGFVIGGFAVIINTLIAKYADNNYKIFLKIVGIVLAVKFLLSPHTPLGAYIAVAFQGLLAAFIFPIFKLNKVSIATFALLVMIESALQKPLMAFFIFGKTFWNTSITVLADFFRIAPENINTIALLLFTTYLLLYCIWAMLLSYWANYISKNIEKFSIAENSISVARFQVQKTQSNNLQKTSRKSVVLLLTWSILLLLLLLLLAKLDIFYILRTFCLAVLLLFVAPVFIKKHYRFLLQKNNTIVGNIVEAIPKMTLKTQIAWQLTKTYKGIFKIKQFIIYTIWLNVFYEKGERHSIFLLTGAIQTGKSEALLQWCKHENMSGFITPTFLEKKILYNISNKEKTLYQAEEGNDTIAIGQYFLAKNAFAIANSIVLNSVALQKKWIVMDEIGKLELNNEGHHDTLLYLLNNYEGNILLVVRDSLLEKIIEKYKFIAPIIIEKADFIRDKKDTR